MDDAHLVGRRTHRAHFPWDGRLLYDLVLSGTETETRKPVKTLLILTAIGWAFFSYDGFGVALGIWLLLPTERASSQPSPLHI